MTNEQPETEANGNQTQSRSVDSIVSNSLFRRLLRKFREHYREKQRLKARIRQLEAKSEELLRRLKMVVKAEVYTVYGPGDIVGMTVKVDRRIADTCRTSAVWSEAMEQLIENLRHELSRERQD